MLKYKKRRGKYLQKCVKSIQFFNSHINKFITMYREEFKYKLTKKIKNYSQEKPYELMKLIIYC